MDIINSKKTVLLIGIGMLLTACAIEPPYIYNAEEFNRDNPNFAKEITDRASVEICYNKRSATPKLLLQMATDECRRFGKKAVFEQQKMLECSVSAPAQAVFSCVELDSKAAQ